MANKDEIATAIAVIKEVANDPSSGAVADLIRLLEDSATATNEVRVIEPKEKR